MMRYGCHGYTWQMSYEQESRVDLGHILDVIERAGFEGIDTQVKMLGPFEHDAAALARELDVRGLELAALTVSLDWIHGHEDLEEQRTADYFIRYLSFFGSPVLNLVPRPGGRSDLRRDQDSILTCVNAIARRAAAVGVRAAFHPNSSPGSVFAEATDYERMFAGLDHDVIGWTPDVGHIAKGRMDPVALIQRFGRLVRHCHFKDIDHEDRWVAMGAGRLDFPGVVQALGAWGYDGWIMVEEESAFAVADPDAAMMQNGRYVREVLRPRADQREVTP